VAGGVVSGFKRAVPVLPALDVAESAAFYRSLGFSVAMPMENYAIVERGSAELHLTEAPIPAVDRTGCYIVVEDVYALHAELKRSGVRLDPPVQQPWGLKEMYAVDPGGNLIRFTQEAVIP
jgi:hypothetical protein